MFIAALLQQLKPHIFEGLCAGHLRIKGFAALHNLSKLIFVNQLKAF